MRRRGRAPSALLTLFIGVVSAQADFSTNRYTDQPDILLRIVTAAENDSRFKSHMSEGMAVYLRNSEYIGPLEVPFGTIQIAQLSFTRSALKDSKNPARGHSYIVFLDANFKIRTYWEVDLPDDPTYAEGNKLWSGKDLVLDYGHVPANGCVLFWGQIVAVPKWNKAVELLCDLGGSSILRTRV